MLNISQNGNEQEQTCALRLPTQWPAVSRDATSLLCHVGAEVDSGHVHIEISYLAGRGRAVLRESANSARGLGEAEV